LSFCRSLALRQFSAAASARQSGIVKFFNVTKGFGFISPSDGGDDVFVHQSNVHAKGFRSLAEGESVEFEVGTGDDGRTKAFNVTGPHGDYVQGVPRERMPSFSAGPRFSKGGGAQMSNDEW